MARLFDRFAGDLLAFFTRRTFDPDASVELLGETFAAAYVSRERCHADEEGAERAWLYGIARNLLIDYFRRGRVERRALERLGVERVALTDPEYDRVESVLAAQGLYEMAGIDLDALPVDQRDALRMRVIEDQPYDQVARTLGVSEQTARARVSRALRALRSSSRPIGLREVSDHA